MKMKKTFYETLWVLPVVLVVFGVIHLASQCEGEENLALARAPLKVEAKEAPEPDIEREYYETGEVRSIYRYIEGRKTGPAYHFYRSGNLWKREYYRDDVLNGQFAMLYDGGGLKCLGTMKEGVPEGEITHFNRDRTVQIVELFSEGILINRTCN
jgi:antitoxin component YwqK of YwqJK toxin-antitoxin module